MVRQLEGKARKGNMIGGEKDKKNDVTKNIKRRNKKKNPGNIKRGKTEGKKEEDKVKKN